MVKVPVNTVKRASFARLARVAILALGVAVYSDACTPPKLTAGSGVRGDVTPPADTIPQSDTSVVPSSRKRKQHGDVVLIYAIALLIVAVTYFKISNTDVR